MAKIGAKIELLKRTYPRVLEGGYMFATDRDLVRSFKRAVVWVLLSDGERYGLRSLDFLRRSTANYHVWTDELPARYEMAINNLKNALNHRHSGVWRVVRIVGWAGGANAVRVADRTRPHGAGRRTK